MLANFSNLITFSRGSNATVTDASGRLTYAPHNLVTNSQDFESANWQKNAVTVTANAAVAPDSTATADQIAFSSTSAFIFYEFSTTTPNVTYIFSVWLRAAAATTVILSIQQSGGSVSNSTISLTTEWQRFFVSYTTSGSPTFIRPRIIPNSNTPTFLAWGAQLEAVTYQTTPSPYVSTSVANLLGFSEAFDNAAWTKQRASIVPNAAQNPINNLWNAQKLMEDTTASNTHRLFGSITTTAIPYTLSVYMKAGERNWAYLRLDRSGGTTAVAWFNLSTGAVGTVQTGLTASIQSVGNGWYRCSATIDAAVAGAGNPLIGVTTANGTESYTGDGNSGIYIYGAQLSNSGSLDPYVPTPGAAPSSTAYYGPRFDYDPVTLAAKGILIEEQRTNLLTYSNDYADASWTALGAKNLAANTTVSPDGLTNASTLTDNSAVAYQGIQKTVSVANDSATYTASVYIRKTTGGTSSTFGVNLQISGGTTVTTQPRLNTDTGILINGVGTVQNAGAYWRLTCSVTNNSSGNTSLGFSIYPATSPYNVTTDSSAATGAAIIYGAQLEAGAFATSYIPTVASTVTRSADVALITGSLFSQWYRQDEGTFVVNFDRIATNTASYSGGQPRVFRATDEGVGSNFLIACGDSGAGEKFLVRSSGVDVAAITSGVQIAANTTGKMASAYATNNFGLSVNGGAVGSDTSGASPVSINTLHLGDGASSTRVINGHIQNIQYIPNAVSSSQLQWATS